MNTLVLFWVFLASNSLHDLGGQIKLCSCYNTKNFEQTHWNKTFYRMYGLAMMLSISTQTNLKNIDKIVLHKIVKTNPIIKTSQDSLNALVNNWQSKFVCCALKYIRKKRKAIASLSSRRWVYALRLYCLLSMMSRQKLCMWFYEPGITNVLNSFLKEPSLFCVFVLSWKRLRQKRF